MSVETKLDTNKDYVIQVGEYYVSDYQSYEEVELSNDYMKKFTKENAIYIAKKLNGKVVLLDDERTE